MGSIPCLPPRPLASWLFWECIRLSPTTGPCHSMFLLPGNSQLPLLGSIVVSFRSQPKRYHLRGALSELLSKGVSLHPQPNLCALPHLTASFSVSGLSTEDAAVSRMRPCPWALEGSIDKVEGWELILIEDTHAHKCSRWSHPGSTWVAMETCNKVRVGLTYCGS